jgi:hypothetical protein
LSREFLKVQVVSFQLSLGEHDIVVVSPYSLEDTYGQELVVTRVVCTPSKVESKPLCDVESARYKASNMLSRRTSSVATSASRLVKRLLHPSPPGCHCPTNSSSTNPATSAPITPKLKLLQMVSPPRQLHHRHPRA